LSRGNIMINSSNVNVGTDSRKLDIYLCKSYNSLHEYLLPVSIAVTDLDGEVMPRKIVEFLAKDYSEEKLYTNISANTVLNKSSINGNEVSLSFNKAFTDYGGSKKEDMLLKQLFYSMMQFKGIEKMRLAVDEIDDELPEGTDISKALVYPEQINDIINR